MSKEFPHIAASTTKHFLSQHAADNYRPDIDGLRAFAVLSVVLYHAFPNAIRGGYVGVDIFFVISGFLISSILFTEITEHRFSFTAFYGRRIRRIFPALVLQGQGAKVYLVLSVPVHHHFNPGEMVTRSVSGFQIAPDVEKAVPVSELRAVHAAADAKLRTIAEHTGATLLDPLPDICGSGDACLPFFGAGEPKFSDGTHLRPVFVREDLRFLDPLLK